MATFLMTWNPVRLPIDEVEWDDMVDRTAKGEEVEARWTTGVAKKLLRSGDDGFFLRQTKDRGIVGTCRFLSEVYEDDHWAIEGKTANYADLVWTRWVPIEDRLPVETLIREIPEIVWNNIVGSGYRVPDDVESRLWDLWDDHIGA